MPTDVSTGMAGAATMETGPKRLVNLGPPAVSGTLAGQEVARALAPYSRSELPRRLSPPSSASSSCDRPAPNTVPL